MKLSIIIPVYRTQDTLERCLESILQQSFTDYEMILVDDGSDDGSPQLCDEYARKDARIRVIHKENGENISPLWIAMIRWWITPWKT